MESKIVINKVYKKDSIISLDYDVSDNLKEFFDMDNKFKVDYYCNIESVPNSIAVIPFISNVLPIIWLTNSELVVDELDYEYAKSLDRTKEAFNDMYNIDDFKGKIKINKIIKNNSKTGKKNVSVFCSGGVDSSLSIIECLKKNQKPYLITLWGSDVWDYNTDGWKSLYDYTTSLGKKMKLNNLYIKSNFRKFINEHVLTEKLLKNRIDDSWWHGIQHGIGLIGHVAPFAYLYNIVEHNIPATLNPKTKHKTCASYPTIDESVKFINCKINHSGYEYNRQEKIAKIAQYFKDNPIELRVCYMDKGKMLNCCNCEKCYRTIMELVAVNENPRVWGFDISDGDISKIPIYLKKNGPYLDVVLEEWDNIIIQSIKNKKNIQKNKYYKWILKYKNERNFFENLTWRRTK